MCRWQQRNKYYGQRYHHDAQGDAAPAGTITLNVTPTNDPPTATNTTQTQNYNEGDAAVAIDDIVISDIDSTNVTASLQLNNTSTGTLTADSGNGETYNGTSGIWTISGSIATVNAALADLEFVPDGNNETNTTVSVTITDAQGDAAPGGSISLLVSVTNVDPLAFNVNQTILYVEDAPSVEIGDIVVIDPDAGDLITATLTLDDVTKGQLTAGTGHGETVSAAGVWTITGSVLDVNAALEDVKFVPTLNNDLDTSFSVEITDARADVVLGGQVDLTVTPVNDSPTNLGFLPSALGAAEDVASTLVLFFINLDDVDSTTESLTMRLQSEEGGRFFATGGSGITISGSNSNRLDLTGGVAELNKYLDEFHVSFLGAPDSFGNAADTVHVFVRDTNVGGSTGPVVDLGDIKINIQPTNDAPVAINDQYSATSGEVFVLSGAGLLNNDFDVDDDPLTATLIDGPANGILRFNGDGSFSYEASPGFQGTDSFTYVAKDGTTTSDPATVTFLVTAAPPPPTTGGGTTPPPTPTPTPTPAPTPTPETPVPVVEAPPDNIGESNDRSPGRGSSLVESNDLSLGAGSATSSLQVALATQSNPQLSSFFGDPLLDDSSRGTIGTRNADDRDELTDSLRNFRNDPYVVSDQGHLWQELDTLSDEIAGGEDVQLLSSSSVVFTSAFTVGYVVWLLRAGQLLTGILAQMPAWHLVDPLPVLDNLGQLSDEEDDESLQSMIDKGAAV